MDTILRLALAAPGRITNIWGKSGAGKTCLALDLALSEILEENGKAIFITDNIEPVATQLAGVIAGTESKYGPGSQIAEAFVLIRSHSFTNQGELVQLLPFAFLPDTATRESVEFNNFVETGENDINEMVIESFKAYKPPSLVIIDEITRQYKHLSIEMEDPGPLNLQLLAQLGFLKKIAAERGIKVVITSATRTIASAIGGNEEGKFIDVPIASDVLDHYIDIDAQLQWTRSVGERSVVITDASERGKQLYRTIDMNTLYKRLAGGMLP